jgi:methyl-accepting chemotaxis protein
MSRLRHAPIALKVALAPMFELLCLLLVAGVGVWATATLTRTLAHVNEARMPALELAAGLERRIAAIHAMVYQSLVWEGAGAKAESIAALDKRIVAEFQDVARLLAAEAARPTLSGADRDALKQVAHMFGKFTATVNDTLDMKSMGLGAASGFITRSDAGYAELSRLLDQFVKQQQQAARADVSRGARAGRTSLLATVAALAVAVVLCALATWWCARLIVGPLRRAVAVLQAVARGDFTQTLVVESRDEVGQAAGAVNEAVAAMHTALREVSAAAEQAAGASREVSSASTQLSGTVQSQASSLEETAASLEEITGTVKQSADAVRQANQFAVASRQAAERGGQVVADAVAAMGDINRASRRIADIITTIDEIAFQTNLLALNAAVEAARAGEQGRGFAVVAAEVRNLAQRSAGAAREIKGLIEDSVAKVDAGSTLVHRSGETLTEIVSSVKRVTDIIAEIAAAAQEQSTGIDQVNRAVTQMDQVTQANATQTDQLASTARALAGQAEQLHALVGRFRLDAELDAPPPSRGAPEAAPPATPWRRAPRAGHAADDRAADALLVRR